MQHQFISSYLNFNPVDLNAFFITVILLRKPSQWGYVSCISLILCCFLVLMIFKEGSLTFMSICYYFSCEITLESVSGNNQY